jgi:carbamoyl-phosphate synthase large subunit
MLIKHQPSHNDEPLMVVRPMPFTMVAFLDKVTGIDWMRLVIRYMLNRQTHVEQQFLAQLKSLQWRIPKAQLTYWHADFEEHMEIDQMLDNGRYAIGATYHLI